MAAPRFSMISSKAAQALYMSRKSLQLMPCLTATQPRKYQTRARGFWVTSMTKQSLFIAPFHATAARRADTEERVKKIIMEQLGVKEEEVQLKSRFDDDMGADSLDTVEMVMALEEEFGIEIPDEEAAKILTVQNAIDCVRKLYV